MVFCSSCTLRSIFFVPYNDVLDGILSHAELVIGLTGIGLFFPILGVVFLFDAALIAMGNVLFVSGLATTIGPQSTLKFFMKKRNWKGTGFFMAGMLVVFWGWGLVGTLIEAYGFVLLFAGAALTEYISFGSPGTAG